MRNLSLVCLLSCALSWAQTPTSVAPAAIGENDAVITIKGLCVGASNGLIAPGAGSPCQTIVTRKDFERLVDTLQPNMTATSKQNLAKSVSQLLLMAQQAEQLGLDKQEHFREELAYARLKILSEELNRNLQARSAEIPESEIESYYREHPAMFERITFELILVPVTRQTDTEKPLPPSNAVLEQESTTAMARTAEQLHQRAVAGEDFVKLQQAAYDAATVQAPIPPTKFANIRRRGLPDAHLSIFNLKPGQVSEIISDKKFHYIYKLDSKDMMSLDEARAEIHTSLQAQHFKAMATQLQESATTELNPSYFPPVKTVQAPTPAELANPGSDQD